MTRVAVTQRVVRGEHDEVRDALAHDWAAFFERYGIVPVLLPNGLSAPEALLDGVEAVLLTGGGDVPAGPGEAPGAGDVLEQRRYRLERRLLAWARERRAPVLAVCRGMQALNVILGGGLTRDLAAVAGVDAHVGAPHAVHLRHPDVAAEAGGDRFQVNSYHRQGVREGQVAEALRVLAVAAAGVVEAVAHRDLPWIGMQWHPERPSPSPGLDQALVRRWLSGRAC